MPHSIAISASPTRLMLSRNEWWSVLHSRLLWGEMSQTGTCKPGRRGNSWLTLWYSGIAVYTLRHRIVTSSTCSRAIECSSWWSISKWRHISVHSWAVVWAKLRANYAVPTHLMNWQRQWKHLIMAATWSAVYARTIVFRREGFEYLHREDLLCRRGERYMKISSSFLW